MRGKGEKMEDLFTEMQIAFSMMVANISISDSLIS